MPVEVVKAPGGSVLVFVSVTIQGQGPYTFVLDTGASRTAISPDLAQELGLPEAGIQGEVSGVTGTQQVRLVEIESWSVDGVEFPPSTIVSIELPTVSNASRLGDLLGTDALEDMQGLLGSDILSGFGTIVIDYENQRLILGADIRTLETGR